MVETIDITDESGARKGQTYLGIYEVKGDEFRVVFAAPGEERPTKFEAVPKSGQWLHIWKRVQQSLAAPRIDASRNGKAPREYSRGVLL